MNGRSVANTRGNLGTPVHQSVSQSGRQADSYAVSQSSQVSQSSSQSFASQPARQVVFSSLDHSEDRRAPSCHPRFALPPYHHTSSQGLTRLDHYGMISCAKACHDPWEIPEGGKEGVEWMEVTEAERQRGNLRMSEAAQTGKLLSVTPETTRGLCLFTRIVEQGHTSGRSPP